eukprot:1955666-Amphidinium_carterae.1
MEFVEIGTTSCNNYHQRSIVTQRHRSRPDSTTTQDCSICATCYSDTEQKQDDPSMRNKANITIQQAVSAH